MKTKEDRRLQAMIQIDACRQRIEFLQKRLEEETRYINYLRKKYEEDLKEPGK